MKFLNGAIRHGFKGVAPEQNIKEKGFYSEITKKK